MSTANSRRNWIKQSSLALLGLPVLAKNSYILPVKEDAAAPGKGAASIRLPVKEDVMTHYLCTTCGVQYEASGKAPAHCPICEDERQYVNPGGQSWTTLEQVQKTHKNIIEMVAPDLYAIYTTPDFAIGQRAHLLITPSGNILWDCIANLDASTVNIIQRLGGIKAIALSHPHYFSTIVEWSHAFGGIPVYVHQADAAWLQRRDSVIKLWSGNELPLWDGIKLVLCGGHFAGGNVLYSPAGKGCLLVGDVIQVSSDRKTVSVMYSYPNNIPLSAREIDTLHAAVKPLQYDAMYGAFGKYIKTGAREAVDFSLERYRNRIR